MNDNNGDAAGAASGHDDMDDGRSTQSSASHITIEPAVPWPEDLNNGTGLTTAQMNELTQDQPASLPTPTAIESRPREGKEPETPETHTADNNGSSQGASSSRIEELGAMHDMTPIERRRILAQYFDNINLPEGERIITADRQPDHFHDDTVPTPSTARPQSQSPIRAEREPTGERTTTVTITVDDGTTVELEPANSLTDENLRQRQEQLLRTSGHSIYFNNPSHGSEGETQTSRQVHAPQSRIYDGMVHADVQRHSNSSQYTGDHSSLPDRVPGSELGLINGQPVPEVVVPRWQPDAEVTLCPICGTQFSFFVRKHHCRKCGRVVCNNCSPHRITIPHQFIVHMPEEHPAPRAPPSPQRSLATWSDSSSDVASLGGGGQRVRLCNPCVPDPNIAPPQSPLAENQPRPSPSGSHNRSTSLASNSFNQLLGPDSQIGNATWRFLHPDYAQYANPPPPISRQSAQGTGRRSTVSSVASGSSSHQQDNASSVNQNRDGRTSMNDFFADEGSHSLASILGLPGSQRLLSREQLNHLMRHDETREYRQRWTPTLRAHSNTAQQDDADLCPVCHQRLPTRSSNQEELETLKEAHINECIEASIRGSRSSPPVPTSPRVSLPSFSLPSSSLYPGATPGPYTPMLLPRSNMTSFHATPSPLPRRTGLFPYQATEKDCVDDAECTICFEEFEVGVDMGRLECFCRFHLDCINLWFNTHPGQCPVHQYDS